MTPKPSVSTAGVFRCEGQADPDCARWISSLKGSVRGLEQNPKTASRWAKLAREGKKVMQFLDEGRYLAVVVDGKVQFYGRAGDRK